MSRVSCVHVFKGLDGVASFVLRVPLTYSELLAGHFELFRISVTNVPLECEKVESASSAVQEGVRFCFKDAGYSWHNAPIVVSVRALNITLTEEFQPRPSKNDALCPRYGAHAVNA